MSFIHPCLKCGACCSFFRVEFYWREANPEDHNPTVPQNLWVEQTDRTRVMKGTEVKHGIKCVGLKGKIGLNGHCVIYQNRPSPCRNFEASFENGIHNPKCDQARAHHGLAPLSKLDFVRQSDFNDLR